MASEPTGDRQRTEKKQASGEELSGLGSRAGTGRNTSRDGAACWDNVTRRDFSSSSQWKVTSVTYSLYVVCEPVLIVTPNDQGIVINNQN